MSEQREPRGHLDYFREVLDHVVEDVDGVPCGTVDDIDAEGGIGGPLRAVALVVGPGAFASRLPALFEVVARALAGRRSTHVPWREVAGLGERIRLRSKASELGLGVPDRKLGRYVARLPLAGRKPE